MGKKAKEHRKKVANRNARMKQEKAKYDKMRKNLIEQLIKSEQEKGLFDNTQTLPDIQLDTDGPQLGA